MRKLEFKTGIGNGKLITDRHREKNDSLRKDKRQKAMLRVRGISVIDPNASFTKMFEEYMKMPTIERLFYLLKQATEVELITNANVILQGGKVLRLLSRAMGGADRVSGIQALSCLSLITSVEISEDEKIYANILCEPVMFAPVVAHIEEDTEMAIEMWALANNLIAIGLQSKVTVLASSLFNNPNAFIFQELRRKRPAFQKVIIRIISTSIRSHRDHLPSRGYIELIWPFVIDAFYTNLPLVKRQTTDDDQETIGHLCALLQAFKAKSQQEDDVVFFGQLALRNIPFISYLMQLVPYLGMENQQRIAFFLVKVSLFNMPSVMEAMRAADGLSIMHHLTQTPNEELQINGVKWIANYCLCSLGHVQNVFDQGAFSNIGRLMTIGHKYKLLESTIWLFTAACNSCVCALDTNYNVANKLLFQITQHASILKITISAITKVAEVHLLCDILDLWTNLVHWNPEKILSELDSMGAEYKLSLLLQHKDSNVFDKAEVLMDAMDNHCKDDDDDDDVRMTNVKTFSF